MLFELFAVFQVICIVLFGAAFFTRNSILWALTAVVAALLSTSSFNIQTHDAVVTNVTSTIVGNVTTTLTSSAMIYDSKMDGPLFAMNLGFFLLSLVLFFYDIYNSDIQKHRY